MQRVNVRNLKQKKKTRLHDCEEQRLLLENVNCFLEGLRDAEKEIRSL